MLHAARSLGDELVIVLTHDAHNRKPTAVPAERRKRWMEELGIADSVVIGRADGFAETLRREKPDTIALGHDQRLPDAETEAEVKRLGIGVVHLPWSIGRDEVVFPREDA